MRSEKSLLQVLKGILEQLNCVLSNGELFMTISSMTFHLYELCWLEGLRAHLKGDDESANPHLPDTREHDYWHDGWWETCLNEGDILSHFAD